MIRKIILVAIILASLTVVGAVGAYFYFNPETMAKRDIEHLARQYYEEYFYVELEKLNGEELKETLANYEKSGFSKVRLRQLLAYDAKKHGVEEKITQYCDADRTDVQFFPHAPFGKKDYKIQTSFACNF